MDIKKLNPYEIAKKHPIIADKPACNFFEGALLGNGAMGAVVTTRPDAVVIHFGHNNVWDIRVSEKNEEKIGSFKEVFNKILNIPEAYGSLREDPWFREYYELMRENYSKSYPRPFPCGSLLLGFDRKNAELLGHKLDIATGVCEIYFLADGEIITLKVFVEMKCDRLWIYMGDEKEGACKHLLNRIKLIPDPETPQTMPKYQINNVIENNCLSFTQILPALEPEYYDYEKGHPEDRMFSLSVKTNVSMQSFMRINWEGIRKLNDPLEMALRTDKCFIAYVQLDEGCVQELKKKDTKIPFPSREILKATENENIQSWKAFWEKSGVALEDDLLESIWYRNLYFFNCSVKPGVTCPGLFANWSYRNIGTPWHGDYHMNYNTQQPFWVTFSSNHVDKHLPYVDLIDRLRPISKKWAKEYYGLRGACFPHVAYPVEMKMNPYPVPIWGWQICETPWTVQSLWWHYLYTKDKEFLKTGAFEPIKEAVLFLVDYMHRPECRGEQWRDKKYHIYPTVVPELYGLTPGLKKNYDCIADLTLTKFMFKAYKGACSILEVENEEKVLLDEVEDILENFPEYPTVETENGKIFVATPESNGEEIYNVPVSTMTIFPGEEHGLHSSPEEYKIALNTYISQKNEGGNDLVFLNMQAARLGILDIEKFKRQIRYCLLPNGTCTDMVLQSGGRYKDETAFDFMADNGIWFENFALPAVINECLLQSYKSELRFFPNWPKGKRAEFYNLRAVGAFLVSAAFSGDEIEWIEIYSEAGDVLNLIIPWKNGARLLHKSQETVIYDERLKINTHIGETIWLLPLNASK